MKKILLLVVVAILLVTGCGMEKSATPTERVEEWMMTFQKRDEGVVKELTDWLMGQDLEEEDRNEYQNALEKQYQNLSYEIVSEEINGEDATVVAEIEVLDYHSSMVQSRDYFANHQEEFIDEVKEDNEIDDLKEFTTYKIKELSKVEDKTKYQIIFELVKINNDWQIQDIDSSTFLKMYGLY